MNKDQVRAEFEAWWRREYGNTLYCESAWRGWQASRAALEVELPSIPPLGVMSYEARSAACDIRSRFQLAITAAGVKVKP